MGFALWLTRDTAWAQGTHEYRPMGAAVIASTSLFHARDFSAKRRSPRRDAEGFAGLFPSLEELNRYLRLNRSQAIRRNRNPKATLVLPTI